MSDLKPCPFCDLGGAPTLRVHNGRTFVECVECYSSGKEAEGIGPSFDLEATEQWDARPVEEALTLERDDARLAYVKLSQDRNSEIDQLRADLAEAREAFRAARDYAWRSLLDDDAVQQCLEIATAYEEKLSKEVK